MEADHRFSKKDKLKSKKKIDLLFSKGKSINAFPIRAIYFSTKELNDMSVNTGVSVPKKKIKLAVNRNLLKRRMREAYRLNNQALKNQLKGKEEGLDLMFVYTSKQISSYKEIEDKIKVILARLTELGEVIDK